MNIKIEARLIKLEKEAVGEFSIQILMWKTLSFGSLAYLDKSLCIDPWNQTFCVFCSVSLVAQAQPWVGGRHSTAVAFALRTQPARVQFPAFLIFFQRKNLMLLGFNDRKRTAYTVDSASCLIVIWTHLVLASGKLVLQKNSALGQFPSKTCQSK